MILREKSTGIPVPEGKENIGSEELGIPRTRRAFRYRLFVSESVRLILSLLAGLYIPRQSTPFIPSGMPDVGSQKEQDNQDSGSSLTSADDATRAEVVHDVADLPAHNAQIDDAGTHHRR